VVFPELLGSILSTHSLQDLLSAGVLIHELSIQALESAPVIPVSDILGSVGYHNHHSRHRQRDKQTFVTSYTSSSTMIQSDSGFLCSATSDSLKTFDIVCWDIGYVVDFDGMRCVRPLRYLGTVKICGVIEMNKRGSKYLNEWKTEERAVLYRKKK